MERLLRKDLGVWRSARLCLSTSYNITMLESLPNDALGTLVKLVRFGQIFRFVKIVQNMYLTKSHHDIEIGMFLSTIYFRR